MTQRLHECLAQQAEQRPDATALVLADQRLSYGELDRLSSRLARALVDAGCGAGDRVCLLVPKSLDAIVAIYAILKAGCIVVPMDGQSPAARLAKITEACRPRLILGTAAQSDLHGSIRALSRRARIARLGLLELARSDDETLDVFLRSEDIERRDAAASDLAAASCEPAYLLYTSGSTGTPKGVVVTHASVLGFVAWAQSYFQLTPSDRISQHPPLHFDLSIFDIFGSCAAGAELHLVPPTLNIRADKLAEFIRDSALTQWFSVPSALTYLEKFDVVAQDDFPTLKRLLWCGEVLPTPTLINFMRRLPHVQFTNLYGPTEATIASSHWTLPRCPAEPNAPVPIGRPCDGESLLVLDDNLEAVAPGTIGDLYIGGIGLSPGYWEDHVETQAAFLDGDSPGSRHGRIYKTGDLASVGDDGLLYFHGRSDSQVKCRGYRIELGEIETALVSLDALSACAVVAIESGGFEGVKICCAFEPKDGTPATAQTLRTALSKVLPGYMVPTLWKAFAVLPKNGNGKIDRRRLREDAETWAPGRDSLGGGQSRASTPSETGRSLSG